MMGGVEDGKPHVLTVQGFREAWTGAGSRGLIPVSYTTALAWGPG